MKQKIKTALVSVSDKSDLPKILKTLLSYKIKIISSGGSYRYIKESFTIIYVYVPILL